MRAYKVLHEHDDHFEVDDGSDKPFKVAKGALRHTTVEKIRRYAEGGEVGEPPHHPNIAAKKNLDEQYLHFMESTGHYANQDARANPYGPPPPAASSSASAPIAVDPSTGAPTESQSADPLAPIRFAIGQDLPAGAPPAVQGVPAGIARPDGALPDGTPAPVIPASAAVADATTRAPSATAGVGAPSDLTAGAKQEQAGIAQRAEAVKGEASATTGVLDNLAQQRQALQQKFTTDLVDRQAKADAMFNDIQAGKIDPNRLWSTRTTGQRVSAAIGLVLGGIGAGLTGGPNYALQVIDKAIDRDMDAQKLELGKKENLLGHYMQQGRDALAAHQMAKADLLDVASAQLQKVSASYAGQKAAADAQIASGQLRQNAAVMRQQATQRSIEIANGKLGLQASQYQQQALVELMKGIKGGGGFDSRVLELPAFKDYRERAVHLPDGSVAFAADKEEANKVRESMATVGRLKSKLQRFRQLAQNGNPVTTDRGVAKSDRADLLSEMGHLHDLNRLSDMDLKLFEDQVPDLTDLIKPNAMKKLQALGQSIDDKVWSTNQALLARPGRRPGG